MHFFDLLPEKAMGWFLLNTSEMRMLKGDVLIKSGETTRSLYILIEGSLGLFAEDYDEDGVNEHVGALYPGALIGEMSFLDNHPTSTFVVAEEECLLLEMTYSNLAKKEGKDKKFGATFYQSLAKLLAQKLRKTTEEYAAEQQAARQFYERFLEVHKQ